ncbi:MAG: HD domain-containing phosphohydrolase [Usitatibacter sp.]
MTYEYTYRLAEQEGPRYQAVALLNIGTALNYCGLYAEAIACLQRAIGFCTRDALASDLDRTKGMALGNMAQSYLYLERFEQGYEAIKQSLAETEEPNTGNAALSRAIREWIYVLLALELGRLAEARLHSAECRKYATWGANPRGAALADISEGLCEVFGGSPVRGTRLLESALGRAENDSQKEDALRALVKCYDATGRHGDALNRIDELISLLRCRGEKGLSALIAEREVATTASLSPDFRGLEYREAKLRAKVAEKKGATDQREFLERLAVAADLKEDLSGEHGYRVGKLSSLLARRIGIDDEMCEAIEVAARLHDIGKIGVPDRILLTSEKLKETDRRSLFRHAAIGSELLSKSELPYVRIAESIARCHHEWWNGEGYPSGHSGKRIPLHARLVAIADVFDALTHGRPYAALWTAEDAIIEIRSRSGSQFDPELVGPFVQLIADLQSQHEDLDEFLGRAARASTFWQARSRIRSMLETPMESSAESSSSGSPLIDPPPRKS